MMEHPTKRELDEYRSRVLAPAAFLSIHRHVATCPGCAAQCPDDLARDLEVLHTALLQDETPYHLSPAEVAAYARGTANEIDLEIADSHLSDCAPCRNEVQRHAPAEVKMFKPQRLSFTNAWRIAAAVACAIIVIGLPIWLIRSKPAPHEGQVANPANTSTPAPEVQPSLEVVPEFALVLNDGNRKVTVDKQGTLAGLELLPSPVQQKVRAALQTGRLEQSSALAQVKTERSTLLGMSNGGLPFPIIGPLGEVVRSERPTFRWHSSGGVQSYTVTVTDADLNVIATSPPLKTTQWRISKSLKAGGIYAWQVTALKDDGTRITAPVLPAPQAKFKIVDRSIAEMLQQAKSTYPDSHLTLAVLYAEAGLIDDAEQELRMLIRDNPQAGIAQKLLRQVQAMR
ncbi:MAG TPA: tetratricopeptide repeat protein [Pyrinomonadaceae bacterium]|nr:tetratricopeptide repeat protein [Pyrinomonadaceae bacterium]